MPGNPLRLGTCLGSVNQRHQGIAYQGNVWVPRAEQLMVLSDGAKPVASHVIEERHQPEHKQWGRRQLNTHPSPYFFVRLVALRYTKPLSRLPTATTVTSTILSSTW